MKLGKRTWENSIRKFMDVALRRGPWERDQCPLPELEANQLDLLWDGRGGCLWDFSPVAPGGGDLVGRYQDVAYSTRATSCPHLHFFRGSLPLPP